MLSLPESLDGRMTIVSLIDVNYSVKWLRRKFQNTVCGGYLDYLHLALAVAVDSPGETALIRISPPGAILCTVTRRRP